MKEGRRATYLARSHSASAVSNSSSRTVNSNAIFNSMSASSCPMHPMGPYSNGRQANLVAGYSGSSSLAATHRSGRNSVGRGQMRGSKCRHMVPLTRMKLCVGKTWPVSGCTSWYSGPALRLRWRGGRGEERSQVLAGVHPYTSLGGGFFFPSCRKEGWQDLHGGGHCRVRVHTKVSSLFVSSPKEGEGGRRGKKEKKKTPYPDKAATSP